MRITTGSGVRPQIYDRNPTAIFKTATASVIAGTGLTVPWTYTVPAGRKALVTHAEAHAIQAVAGTVPVEKVALVAMAGAGTTVDVAMADYFNNAIGMVQSEVASPQALLAATQTISGIYSNNDATGTMTVYLNGAATEFDA